MSANNNKKLDSRILETTNRLRLIQVDFADESDQTRVEYLCEEVERALKMVMDRDKFKLMPQSLANQRVFGVKLAQELYPPVELPAQVGLHYFRVMRSGSARLWERITQEKACAVRWPGIESSDFDVTLYMTVPDTEA